MRAPLSAAALALLLTGSAPATPPPPAPVSGLEYLGRAVLPRGRTFDGAVVGGLSGLGYDPAARRFWALSDDRGAHGPSRCYRVRIALGSEGGKPRLGPESVTIETMLPLRDAKGNPFEPASLDPEGIARRGDVFFVSSEGISRKGIPAFVAQLRPDGRVLRELPLPERYWPAPGRGVRENLGFESLALTPDARYLFAGLENALAQDGPEATRGSGSPSRLLRFDVERGGRAEFVYPVEPVRTSLPPGDAFELNGLSDLLPLDDLHLLALERQFVEGAGNSARLYEVSLEGATDVSSVDALAGATYVPVKKTLLLDLVELGVPLENFEGMAFGEDLPDGRGTLVLVSDDNFNPKQEPTTFLVLAVDRTPATVARVQGASHRSPLEGRWVAGLDGVVTAVDKDARSPGFWLESATPDGDPATSEGLFALWPDAASLVPGKAVRLWGRVEEPAQGKGLPVTRLKVASLVPLEAAPALPPPARLFSALPMPAQVDDDGLSRFEPEADAIDRWESLEGMRVEVPGGTVVGPTASYGELVLRPDGASQVLRTTAGGVKLPAGTPSVERVILGRKLTGKIPSLDVGSRVSGPITGVVDHSFANYKVLPLSPLPVEKESRAGDESTALEGDRKRLTAATFNVENLSVAGEAERFAALGEVIARRLRAPDLVALEEVQDDSGPAGKGDGVVTSRATLEALVAGIASAGGPRYEPVWIDPVEGREGGQPGGNIRVALLLNPARVTLVKRGTAGPLDATEPLGRGKELHLSLSPGRVAPLSPAFDLKDGEGARRSLAVELLFGGRKLFVVVNHWSSKSDDDRLFGAHQPPRRPTDAKRLAQAREIRSFAEALLAADPKAAVLVLGDLNDSEHFEGTRLLAAPPLASLLELLPEADRYTFNFEGASGLLDHVVVSPALSREAEVDVVHLNSDRADERRSSDHDPVVVRLRVP